MRRRRRGFTAYMEAWAAAGSAVAPAAAAAASRFFLMSPTARGLHSHTFQLNLSASYGIGVRVGVM